MKTGILVDYYLLRDGYVPIIIDRCIKQEYFKARYSADVSWIKNMFIEKSKKESALIEKIMNDYENETYINNLPNNNNVK